MAFTDKPVAGLDTSQFFSYDCEKREKRNHGPSACTLFPRSFKDEGGEGGERCGLVLYTTILNYPFQPVGW